MPCIVHSGVIGVQHSFTSIKENQVLFDPLHKIRITFVLVLFSALLLVYCRARFLSVNEPMSGVIALRPIFCIGNATVSAAVVRGWCY